MQQASALELIGVLGFKKRINIRNSLVIDELRGNGIKLFLLTDDSYYENVTDYNAMRLLKDC